MDTTNNKGAPRNGTPSETPRDNYSTNAAADQRSRILAALRTAPITTIQARRELDILMPAARVHELRHRYGHEIDLVWVREQTECGRWHKVGMYVLQGEARHE